MQSDSTIGYPDRIGFRAGTGDSYRVFDILTRHRLRLREQPLVVMDAAVRKVNSQEYVKEVRRVQLLAHRYGMTLTTLIHNHLQDRVPWNRLDPLYAEILEHPLSA